MPIVRPPRLARQIRLLLAACCLALATVNALGHRAGHSSAVTTVVVARRALAAGHRLTGPDVRIARWPRRLVPAGTLHTTAEVAGHRAAGPILAGEPITIARLVGRDLASGLSPPRQAVPLRLADARTAEFLRPGDRVDVYATTAGALEAAPAPAAVQPLARGAPVLAVLSDSGADGDASEVVVAVDGTVAARISGVHSSQMFAVVLDPP